MRHPVIAAVCLLLAAPALHAQGLPAGRMIIEAVASSATSSRTPGDPLVVLDLSATIRAADRLDVVVRPYALRRPGGYRDVLLYQAQVRYQLLESVRIDAGIITSPLGLAALEMRPDLNPTVTYPFYYFAPLPALDGRVDGVQILSPGFPVGALVTWSASRLDARVAVTDTTPARYRKTFGGGAPRMAQFVAGAGVTPIPGLRVGAGMARGPYRAASAEGDPLVAEADLAAGDAASATVINVEGEYAAGHTRVTGEWVRAAFETAGADAIARASYLQAVRTLTPRVFAAARLTRASSPAPAAELAGRRSRASAELTAGYRLSRDLTVRGGYEATRPLDASGWRHAAVTSLVWSSRWF